MKYYVIGGMYEPYYYGVKDSLHAAKILATKNREQWYFQGWNVPKVYPEDSVKRIVTKGWITYPDGTEIYVPRTDREYDCWYYQDDFKHWYKTEKE